MPLKPSFEQPPGLSVKKRSACALPALHIPATGKQQAAVLCASWVSRACANGCLLKLCLRVLPSMHACLGAFPAQP